MNKKGSDSYKHIGPIYFIIEMLKNLADQYKYLCFQIYFNKESEMKISPKVIEIYERVNKMLKAYYELFYKFEKKRLVELGKERKKLVEEILELFDKLENKKDLIVLHYLLTILSHLFSLVGPYLTMNL